MILSVKSFSTIVRGMANTIQAAASTTLDFSVGSTLRAWIESVGALALQLQVQALQVLKTTRLATSSGTDVDSFVNDFGLQRLPATSATGNVLFSRYSTGQAAFIPIGTLVKTADGTLSYTVQADPTNPAYNAVTGGYNLAATASNISLPVQCSISGVSGNVLAGFISLLGDAVSGVDYVSNPLAFTNGADAETDANVKTRFLLYIAALPRATLASVEYAISSVQQGLTYQVLENTLPDGSLKSGFFTCIVDDGSGNPPSALLSAVQGAVDIVRPIGQAFSIVAPTVVAVSVSCNVQAVPGASLQTAQASVATAITSYLDSLAAGAGVSYLRIAQRALDSSAGVANITNLLINGATADLPAIVATVYRAGSLSVA